MLTHTPNHSTGQANVKLQLYMLKIHSNYIFILYIINTLKLTGKIRRMYIITHDYLIDWSKDKLIRTYNKI